LTTMILVSHPTRRLPRTASLPQHRPCRFHDRPVRKQVATAPASFAG